MIFRVRLFAWFPDNLFTVHHIAIRHRAYFAVGGTEIKTDAAAMQMAPKQLSGLTRGGYFVRRAREDFKHFLIHLLAHEIMIKLPFAFGRILIANIISDLWRHTDVD